MRTRSSTTKRLLKLVAGISAMAMLAVPAAFAANSEFLPAFSVETLTPSSQAALAWKNVAPNALAGYYTYMPLTAADATLAGFPAAANCAVAGPTGSDCYIITAKKLLQPMSLDFLKHPAVMPDLVALGSPNLFPGPGLIRADGVTPFVDTSTLTSTLASAGSMTLAWGYGSGGVSWQPYGATGPTLTRGNAPVVFQNTPIGLTTFKTDNTAVEGAGVTGIWHFPAPTIKGTSNRPVNVLWLHEVPNEKPLGLDPTVDCGTAAHLCYPYNRIVLHVHGAHVGPESDGLATSWFSPVYALTGGRLNGEDNFLAGANSWNSYQFKTVQNVAGTIPAPYLNLPIYNYPMTQPAGTIWYHDHAIGTTHLNTQMGMAGFFPVTDAVEIALQTPTPAVPAGPGGIPAAVAAAPAILPTGNPTFSTYDVGLALQDRHFDVNGKMAFPDIAVYDKNDPNCVFDANNNALPGTCTRLHWMKKINPVSPTDPQPAVHFIPYVAGAPELTVGNLSYALNFPAGCQVNLVNTLENVAGVDPLTGARIPFTQCAPFPATSATLEYFGNMPVVNGVTYPVYDVEPTVYRFRLIGGTDSRTWIAQLVKSTAVANMVSCGGYDAVNEVYGAPNGCAVYPTNSIVPFYQVGTEQGLLKAMVKRNELDIMGGERIDVLVDFTALGGQTIIMKNLGDDAPYSGRFDFDNITLRQPTSVEIPEIMKFRVSAAPVAASAQTPANGVVLTGVKYDVPSGYTAAFPAVTDMAQLTPTITRTIALIEITDQYGRTMPTIDARGYVPPGIRTTEIMQQNVPERWDIVNTTVDAHPMHIHQVAFLPLNRQALALNPDGSPAATDFKAAFNNGLTYFGVPEDFTDAFRQQHVFTPSQYAVAGQPITVNAYDAGLKDTIQIPPGYVSRNNIVFDILGDYVWHCHILSHEEHDMMRPYRITNAPIMPSPVFTVGAEANGSVPITITPMAAPVPVATQYVVQYRKVGATFWETNGQSTATQSVNITATGPGTYEFRAQIIEPALQTVRAMSRPDSLWVTSATQVTFSGVIIATNPTLPSGVVGAAYTTTLTATGGTGVYTWAVPVTPLGNALPPGFALSAAGVLTAAPATTAGTYTFDITATDTSVVPIVDTQTFTLVVGAVQPFSFVTTSPLTPYTLGAGVFTPVTFTAQGGNPAYTITLNPGSIIPPGLTLTGATLGGTPTTAGTYTFTMRATDSSLPSAAFITQLFSLTVNATPALSITTAQALPAYTIGSGAFSVTFAATGGNGAYTWTDRPDLGSNLPAGTTLSTAGVLSGTPAAGTYLLAVQVMDSSSPIPAQTAVKIFFLTVNPAVAPVVTAPANTTVVAGVLMTPVTFTASNANAKTWSLTGAPVGLSIDAAGVLSGSVAAAGTYNFTVIATDNVTAVAGNVGYTVVVTSSLPTSPTSPTQVGPRGNVSLTPTYTFTAVPNATAYYIYLWNNTIGSGGGTTYAPSAGGCASGTGNCNMVQGTPLVSGHTYSWYVYATNAAGFSPDGTFMVIYPVSAAAPATPAQISPQGTVVGLLPTYTFAPSPGANSYSIELWDNTSSSGVTTTYLPADGGVACAAGTGNCNIVQATPLLVGHTYSWYITAANAAGSSPFTHLVFTVQ
ncbi:MAG: putative Ig domain-containing protein [Desulfuromonadaceae bacterium]